MKRTALLVLALMTALLLSTTASAATYLSVDWFGQPDPNNPGFTENANGSFTSASIPTATIAWVFANPQVMIVEAEIDMTIPDISGDWAGFYVGNNAAANGFGGTLFTFNKDGLLILNQGAVVNADRVGAASLNLGANNRIKVQFLADNGVKVWANGTEIFTKASGVLNTVGFFGLTSLNAATTYKNVMIKSDTGTVFNSLVVAASPTSGTNPSTGDAGSIVGLVALAASAGALTLLRKRHS